LTNIFDDRSRYKSATRELAEELRETIILDKLFAKIEEYRREYPPNEVNQVLSNVREAIEASEDKEALWFWGY
jgi:hypothetical protein